MTDLRKAAEMALNYFESAYELDSHEIEIREALRQALAQPKHEPVAWINSYGFWKFPPKGLNDLTPLYTAPPKREWVGLTDEEVEAWRGNYDFFDSALVKEVEAKLKEKNT